MGSGPTPEEELAALARLLSHPVRVKILAILHDREASASDLAPELGEGVSTVAYHFKLLAEAGALELRDTRQVRGAVERSYRIHPATRRELDGLTEWLGRRKPRATTRTTDGTGRAAAPTRQQPRRLRSR
jgi:DNA-binding transcriptional ArsR family regulator